MSSSTLPPVATSPRISVKELVVQRSGRRIVDKLSFDVNAGEVLGLIGPNGAGKSTVLATLAGIDNPDAGSILVDGQEIKTLSTHERAQRIGWIEQLGTVHWPLSVERLVMLGRIPHLPPWSKTTEQDREAVESALEKADCLGLRHRQVPSLSGGERARVDLGHQLQTMQLLRDYASGVRATVIVMHDLSLAARYCNRLVLMHNGKLVSAGEPAAVLSHQNIADVYGVSVITGCDSVPWVVPEHLL